MLTKLFEGGDPFLMTYGGKYYIYCTTENNRKLESANAFDTEKDGNDGFYVYESEDLINWANKGLCLDKKNVVGNRWFWAPEVSYYNGKFYMLYSAEENLAIAVSESPTGPFVKLTDGWLRNRTIDGHLLFDDDGSIYIYFADLKNNNRIFAGKMSADLTEIEYECENVLIEATEPWETLDCRVAEGPFVLKHNGLYYLSYSVNHTRCEDYAVGYAVSDKPFGPFVKAENNPILHKPADLVGTGHHSFMPTTDKDKFICAFHCHSENPDNFKPRMVCLSAAGFEKQQGKPDRLCISGFQKRKSTRGYFGG